MRIGNIKPLRVPTFQRCLHGKANILGTLARAKLQAGSPNHARLTSFLGRLERKKMAEQRKVGADAEKSLTKMNEGRNLKNGIGVEVDQLNPIEIKKTTEERGGQQLKSPIKQGCERHNFFSVGGREQLTIGRTPSNKILHR